MKLSDDDIGVGPIAIATRALYEATTSRPMAESWDRAPTGMRPYIDFLYGALGEQSPAVGTWVGPEPHPLVDSGHCTVGFSGGKDSLATALLARKDGYEVTLFHVRGLNRAWPDEVRFARECSEITGMPLVEITVHPSGEKKGIPEPVSKNQVIVAAMVEWATTQGVGPAFSMGMVNGDRLGSEHPLSYVHDTEDAHLLFGQWLEQEAPGYRAPLYLRGVAESAAVVAGYEDRRLLYASHGCMAQMRFRPGYRARAEAKFGVVLLPGRCGTSCPKCTSEYVILYHLNALEENELSEEMYRAAREYLGRRPLYDAATRPDLAGLTKDELVEKYMEWDLLTEYRREQGGWPRAYAS